MWPAREGNGCANGDAVLGVIDALAVGENMNVGTFWTKLAISLKRVRSHDQLLVKMRNND